MVGALTLLSLTACRSPRDTALEAKMATAAVQAAAPTAASESTESAESAESAKSTPSTLAPEKGVVTLKAYTGADVARILSTVPGEGPVLRMTLQTEQGTIRCALNDGDAPQTVANLVALASGQVQWRDPDTDEVFKTKFYDGLRFHRAISGFIIQTGNPGAKGAGGPGWTIPRETGAKGAYDQAGVLAMVDAGEDSHGSQFFITGRPAKSLADRYTSFGLCTDIDSIIAISNGEKHPASKGRKSATQPVDPVEIQTIRFARGEALPPSE